METITDEQVLRERDAAWSKAASEGADIDHIVSFWTEDAIVIPPGQPRIEGKPAIRAYVEESLAIPGFRISWSATDLEVSEDGSMAYLQADNEVTVPGPDGSPVTIAGRAVTVWRREADGQWRCAIDIWNDAA